MKLINFIGFETLNSLKSRMGIPRNVFGDLKVVQVINTLTFDELEQLNKVGIDVTDGQYQILPDGTFGYKGHRVVLYIRDVAIYSGREVGSKFHIYNCRTLKDMRSQGRVERYVVATRDDGKFAINLVQNKKVHKEEHELDVCQNCLAELAFDDFNMTWPKNKRVISVRTFSLKRFYEKYPRDLHSIKVKYNSDNAPVNNYGEDWDEISRKVRAKAGWKCSECGLDLSKVEHRKFLDVHHKNGLKYDNDIQNLEPICIGCHAEEAAHSHMKNSPRYREFLYIKHRLR